MFPNAQLVFDRSHVMKPVNEELNKVRKETAMTVKGSLILRHSERLKLAYELKEEFRNIFETCDTVKASKEQFLTWLKKARSVYCDVLKTIRNHLNGICNYFLNRTTRSYGGHQQLN